MREAYQFKREDAERFASEQGIRAWERNGQLHFQICPYCQGNAGHDQKTFAINLKTGQFKCMRASCGVKGNMLTLAKDFDFSLGRDIDEYYRPKRQFKNLSKYPKPISKDPAVAYMESRGISADITKAYGITVQDGHDNILVIPFFDEKGTMQFVKYRKTDFDKAKDKNKEWTEAGCKPILFGMDHCNPQRKTLVMTEGQIDALSVAEAFKGEVNAVSVPTGAKGFTWVPYCWDFLGKYEELVVFGDHEHGKITLLDEMTERFHGLVKHVRPEDYKDCKDANDLLRKYGRQAVINAVVNAETVPDPLVKEVYGIKKMNIADMEWISSGFRSVDTKLGGFYMGQLIILTGERGNGKSTLASQFMTRALQQGYKVFTYTGELVDFMFQEWVERQMAGPDNIDAKRRDDDFYDYRVNIGCQNRIMEWYRGKFYFYDSKAVKLDDREELTTTIETAYKQYGCRVIFIDNLMTAMHASKPGQDFYRAQSDFVQSLAEMVRKYNILIFLIAHPRKTAGGGEYFRNDDVAGSADVTNLADTILNYTMPRVDDKNPDPNPGDRVLQITKNRLTGKLERSGIKLWYDDASKRITEIYGKFDWELGWENDDGSFDEVPEEFDLPFGD